MNHARQKFTILPLNIIVDLLLIEKQTKTKKLNTEQ